MKDFSLMTFIALAALAVTLFVLRATGRNSASAAGSQDDSATRPAETGKVHAADGKTYSAGGYDITLLPAEKIRELARDLTPQERHILLGKGTERPFCGTLLDNKKEGVYVCRLCGLPLFESGSKFKSGTGWPSFFQPFDRAHIYEQADRSHGMVRVETMCARCRSHLGHVFNDGPPPTGLRYCMNSEALRFYEKGEPLPPESRPAIKTDVAYFAGGCFWGVEDRFAQVPGVLDATSGYQGGTVERPHYKLVCTGRTGHAESVRVIYNPDEVTYRELLEWFFKFHDPTTLNRQGPDVGTQYRSAIFAANDKQYEQAQAYIEELNKSGKFKRKIVTKVEKPAPFYEAEAYHQDYHARHGGSCPLPKME